MSVREPDMPLAPCSGLDTAGATPNARGADGSRSALLEWRATRLPAVRFGLLALLVGWAASIGSGSDGYGIAVRVVLAFTLIVQFRLWDDLADRERDRNTHPQRVLARMDDVRVFIGACAVLGALNLIALFTWRGAGLAFAWGLLCLAVALWYRLYDARGSVHAHVLLLKYPAFVVLLASPLVHPSTTLLAAAALYSAMTSHEVLDTMPAAKARTALLTAHGSVLALAACAPNFTVDGWIAAGAVVGVYARLALNRRSPQAPIAAAYWPFSAALIVFVRLTIGGNP